MKKKLKDPFLKIRYISGFGDLVACILHSKPISPITHFFTKLKEPCQACRKRIYALNLLFPFTLTKLFFSSQEEQKKSFYKEAKEFGYEIDKRYDPSYEGQENEGCCQNNEEQIDDSVINNRNELDGEPIVKNESLEYDNYTLTQKFVTDQDNLKIVVLLYKKN